MNSSSKGRFNSVSLSSSANNGEAARREQEARQRLREAEQRADETLERAEETIAEAEKEEPPEKPGGDD